MAATLLNWLLHQPPRCSGQASGPISPPTGPDAPFEGAPL